MTASGSQRGRLVALYMAQGGRELETTMEPNNPTSTTEPNNPTSTTGTPERWRRRQGARA
jgi:hypothetical protein